MLTQLILYCVAIANANIIATVSNSTGDYYIAPPYTKDYQQDIIICNHPQLCYIACLSDEACKELKITVTSATNFKLLCTRMESCYEIQLNTISTSHNTTIICDNKDACSRSHFDLSSSINIINIYCIDDEACDLMNVYTGMNTNEINIKCAACSACWGNNFNLSFARTVNFECRNGGPCTADASCRANRIYAQHAQKMNLLCSGDECWGNDLYCPTAIDAACDLTCGNNDACRGLHIYVPSDYSMGYLRITEMAQGSADVIELICYDDLATAKEEEDSIYIRSGDVANEVYCECSYCCPFERQYILYNDSDSKCDKGKQSAGNNKVNNLSVGAIVGIIVGVFLIVIVLLWIVVINYKYVIKPKKNKISSEVITTPQEPIQQSIQQPTQQMVMVQMADGTMAMAQVMDQQHIVNQPSSPQYIPNEHVQEAKPWEPIPGQLVNINSSEYDGMNEGDITSGAPSYQ